jgi:hypothetical protein
VVTGARTFRNVADIENPAENLVGIAASSSQGAVTAAQLETRPSCAPAKCWRRCPDSSSVSTAAKERPTSTTLRGFNLDHGTDFATSVPAFP